MVDLKKEIKLSDLFRRRAKEPVTETAKAEEAKPPKESRRRAKSTKPAELALPQIPLMRAVNLMPREEPREKGVRGGLGRVAVALVAVLVFAGLGGGYLFTSSGKGAKQDELDGLRAQLAQLEVPAEKPQETDEALSTEAQGRTTALSTALVSRLAWDRIFREFSLVVPDDVWLTQLAGTTPNATGATASPSTSADPAAVTATTSPNSFTVTGNAPSQASVALLISRLATIPEFTSVQLQSSTAVQESSGRTFQFTVVLGVDPLGAQKS